MLISNDLSTLIAVNIINKAKQVPNNDINFNITANNRLNIKPTIVKDDMPDALELVIDDCKAFNENRISTLENDDSLLITRQDKFISKYDTRFARFVKDFIVRFNESNFTNLSYTIIHERQVIVITNLTYRRMNEA